MWAYYCARGFKINHCAARGIQNVGQHCCSQWRRPGAEFGGTEIFFGGPKISEWRFLWKKFSFSRQKFLMTFFSHRPDFSDFPFLFPYFPYLCYVKCHIWPFPDTKNTFFYSVHTFSRTRQHYFSKYWGDQCMGRPPTSNFWGGPSPSPPLGLRPCTHRWRNPLAQSHGTCYPQWETFGFGTCFGTTLSQLAVVHSW